jgi:hypothetical protein
MLRHPASLAPALAALLAFAASAPAPALVIKPAVPAIAPDEILWWAPTASTLVLVRASGTLEIRSLKDASLLRKTILPDFHFDSPQSCHFTLSSTRDDATLACQFPNALLFIPLATLQPVAVTEPKIMDPDHLLGRGTFGKSEKMFCIMSYDTGDVWALDPETAATVEHGSTEEPDADAVFLSDDGETYLTIGHRQSLSAWKWPAHRMYTINAAKTDGRLELPTAETCANVVAVLDSETSIKGIDLSTGKTLFTLPIKEDQDLLALSPDATHYVLSTPGHLELGTLTAGHPTPHPLTLPAKLPQDCFFSSDGKQLLCLNTLNEQSGKDKKVTLTRDVTSLTFYDVTTGKPLRELSLKP